MRQAGSIVSLTTVVTLGWLLPSWASPRLVIVVHDLQQRREAAVMVEPALGVGPQPPEPTLNRSGPHGDSPRELQPKGEPAMWNPIPALSLPVPGNRWTTTRLPDRARASFLSLSFLVLGTLVSACATETASLNIRAGHVFFQSQPESVLNLGNVPAGFFGTVEGEPSDAIALSNPLRVPIGGRPTGPMGLVGSNLGGMQDVWTAPMGSHWIVHTVRSIRASSPGVNDTDTIVRLTNSLTLDYVGDTGTIGLEMVSLSLQSQAPIEVTYGGGRYSASFHVISVLDPQVTQRQGSMTVIRTGDRSGTLDVRMPGAFRLEFVNTDPNGPRVHDAMTADVDLTAQGVTFKVIPARR